MATASELRPAPVRKLTQPCIVADDDRQVVHFHLRVQNRAETTHSLPHHPVSHQQLGDVAIRSSHIVGVVVAHRMRVDADIRVAAQQCLKLVPCQRSRPTFRWISRPHPTTQAASMLRGHKRNF